MSIGVPTVETSENQLNVVSRYVNRTSITGTSGAIDAGCGGEHRGVGAGSQSVDEVCGCHVEHSADGLAAGPLEERRRHLVPVLDRGAHRPGFEHQSQHVGRVGHRVRCVQAGEQAGARRR